MPAEDKSGNSASVSILMLIVSVIVSLSIMVFMIIINSVIIDHYTHLINESGKVRGGIQRTVKLALDGRDVAFLVTDIDETIENVKQILEKNNRFFGEYESTELDDLTGKWGTLKLEINLYRNSGRNRDRLIWESEKTWDTANKVVYCIEQRSHRSIKIYLALTVLILALIIILILTVILTRVIIQKKTEYRADHDSLTGLYNRHHFMEFLKRETSVSRRTGRGFALLMCDIDFFKNINDSFGHDTGDAVLKNIARILKSSSRESDLVSRYGGEEFMIISLMDDPSSVAAYAERLRKTVSEDRTFELIRVTISIGIAMSKKNMSVEDLVNNADKALYGAKENGRNRTALFGDN